MKLLLLLVLPLCLGAPRESRQFWKNWFSSGQTETARSDRPAALARPRAIQHRALPPVQIKYRNPVRPIRPRAPAARQPAQELSKRRLQMPVIISSYSSTNIQGGTGEEDVPVIQPVSNIPQEDIEIDVAEPVTNELPDPDPQGVAAAKDQDQEITKLPSPVIEESDLSDEDNSLLEKSPYLPELPPALDRQNQVYSDLSERYQLVVKDTRVSLNQDNLPTTKISSTETPPVENPAKQDTGNTEKEQQTPELNVAPKKTVPKIKEGSAPRAPVVPIGNRPDFVPAKPETSSSFFDFIPGFLSRNKPSKPVRPSPGSIPPPPAARPLKNGQPPLRPQQPPRPQRPQNGQRPPVIGRRPPPVKGQPPQRPPVIGKPSQRPAVIGQPPQRPSVIGQPPQRKPVIGQPPQRTSVVGQPSQEPPVEENPEEVEDDTARIDDAETELIEPKPFIVTGEVKPAARPQQKIAAPGRNQLRRPLQPQTRPLPGFPQNPKFKPQKQLLKPKLNLPKIPPNRKQAPFLARRPPVSQAKPLNNQRPLQQRQPPFPAGSRRKEPSKTSGLSFFNDDAASPSSPSPPLPQPSRSPNNAPSSSDNYGKGTDFAAHLSSLLNSFFSTTTTKPLELSLNNLVEDTEFGQVVKDYASTPKPLPRPTTTTRPTSSPSLSPSTTTLSLSSSLLDLDAEELDSLSAPLPKPINTKPTLPKPTVKRPIIKPKPVVNKPSQPIVRQPVQPLRKPNPTVRKPNPQPNQPTIKPVQRPLIKTSKLKPKPLPVKQPVILQKPTALPPPPPKNIIKLSTTVLPSTKTTTPTIRPTTTATTTTVPTRAPFVPRTTSLSPPIQEVVNEYRNNFKTVPQNKLSSTVLATLQKNFEQKKNIFQQFVNIDAQDTPFQPNAEVFSSSPWSPQQPLAIKNINAPDLGIARSDRPPRTSNADPTTEASSLPPPATPSPDVEIFPSERNAESGFRPMIRPLHNPLS